MFKILAILASIILIIGILFWWKPTIFKFDLRPASILGSKSHDNLLTQNTLNNLVDNTKDSLYHSAKSTLDTIFNKQSFSSNKQPSETAVVDLSVVTNPSSTTTNTVTFDFAKNDNLQIKINKGSKYQLQFQNTPVGYCLYIGEEKYEISDEKGVEIKFSTSGKFIIKANFCNLGDKTIGQVIVE